MEYDIFVDDMFIAAATDIGVRFSVFGTSIVLALVTGMLGSLLVGRNHKRRIAALEAQTATTAIHNSIHVSLPNVGYWIQRLRRQHGRDPDAQGAT